MANAHSDMLAPDEKQKRQRYVKQHRKSYNKTQKPLIFAVYQTNKICLRCQPRLLSHRKTHPESIPLFLLYFSYLNSHSRSKHSLDRMHTILCLIKNYGLRRFKHLIRHFHRIKPELLMYLLPDLCFQIMERGRQCIKIAPSFAYDMTFALT